MLLQKRITTDLGKSFIYEREKHTISLNRWLVLYSTSANFVFSHLKNCPLDATLSADKRLHSPQRPVDSKYCIPPSPRPCVFTPFLKMFSSDDWHKKSPLNREEKKTFSKWLISFHFGSKIAVNVYVSVVSAWSCGCAQLCRRRKWLKVPTQHIVVACDFLLSAIQTQTLRKDFVCLQKLFPLRVGPVWSIFSSPKR